MNKVEYKIALTGSKLFDMVMINTAKKLCADYPGLECEFGPSSILVTGELDDEQYAKYKEEMFGEA